ncbi:hypothetical protein [Pseudogracilibacillus sp. SO30301A]|uniref:hypothetical protein n=1 Tax=Pseudogracilibacillus sp. SO30301A TaxID=3098291 RepID=UPI00300E017C
MYTAKIATPINMIALTVATVFIPLVKASLAMARSSIPSGSESFWVASAAPTRVSLAASAALGGVSTGMLSAIWLRYTAVPTLPSVAERCLAIFVIRERLSLPPSQK